MSLKKAFFYCLFFCVFSLYALEISLLVIDADLEIPLEGVHVYVKNTSQASVLTNEEGMANLFISDDVSFPLSIICITPGYANAEFTCTEPSDAYTKEKPLIIFMGLNTVLEGEELVVRAERKGKMDEKSGVSLVRTSEEIKTTAQIGIVEDVMNAVSLLPGVGFKMGMNMEPSIRGGYPKEMGVCFDGVYLLEPFYWDGMVSILSPYMVDRVKLSTGIFSSEYGQGTSGILETSSVKIGDARKLTLNVSTISLDVALELPLGTKNNLFLYTHITDLTTVKWAIAGVAGILKLANADKALVSDMEKITSALLYMPHIYSAYGKWAYNPVPEFSLTTNLLVAYDGVSIKFTDQNENFKADDPNNPIHFSLYPPYTSIDQWKYDDIQGMAGISCKCLLSNTLLLQAQASYTSHVIEQNDHAFYLSSEYDVIPPEYDENGNPVNNDEENALGTLSITHVNEDSIIEKSSFKQQLQGKIFTEIQINDSNSLNLGIEEIFKTRKIHTNSYKQIAYARIIDEKKVPVPGPKVKDSSSIPGNNILNSCAFAFWNFGTEPSLVQGEAGLRAEHYYLWNKKAAFDLIATPVFNPRIRVLYTPIRDKDIFDSLSFSAGSGLYSALSQAASEIEKTSVKTGFTLMPDTAWTSIIGTDIAFLGEIHARLEGYYKHYVSRTYVYADERDGQNLTYYAKNDGKGYATGVDVMIEKSIKDRIDGYITYSFLYARFYNPSKPQYDSQKTTTGDPLNTWYFPEYHRYHTVNTVLNFRLPKNCTLTLSGSFASGNPRKQYIDKSEEYLAGTYTDPALNELLYLELYSDKARNLPDWTVDIRFSQKGTWKNPNHTWEWYIGIENLLGLPNTLYKKSYYEKSDGFFNTTGWTIGEGRYTIDMGLIPIPSFGFKLQL